MKYAILAPSRKLLQLAPLFWCKMAKKYIPLANHSSTPRYLWMIRDKKQVLCSKHLPYPFLFLYQSSNTTKENGIQYLFSATYVRFYHATCHKIDAWHTESRKKRNLPYSIGMYWTNFWPPTVHVQQSIFVKNLMEVGSSYLYASFCTFYVQIGQFLKAQWVFEKSENVKIAVFEGNWGRFWMLLQVQNLIVTRILFL